MSPEVRTIGKRFVVNLNDRIGLRVFRARNCGNACAGESAGIVHAFALGGLHGDLLGKRGHVHLQAGDKLAKPVVRKLHKFKTDSKSANRRFAAGGYRQWRSASWPGARGPGQKQTRSTPAD